ncbi:MAG: phosphatidylinositol mannoside acyltransferase [Acidimicrobiia bacterium]
MTAGAARVGVRRTPDPLGVALGPDPVPHPAYLAYRGAAALAQALPAPVAEPTARALGRAAAFAMPARRRMIEKNLRRATDGRLEGDELRRAVSDSFASYGRYWLELFRLPLDVRDPASVQARFETEGYDYIAAGLEAGKGVVLALPHLGGFDFAAGWFAGRVGRAASVVVEAVDPPELFDWFVQVRRDAGMEVIALGPDAGRTVARTLRANSVVCLLADRDITGDGVEVEFFGERTTLPAGPAMLALRSGAPLIPMVVYFRPKGSHLARIGPPIPVEREGRLRDDVARITQVIAHRFEEYIRAEPTQWHVMQPNWPSDRVPVP